jgi:hypothetical protein
VFATVIIAAVFIPLLFLQGMENSVPLGKIRQRHKTRLSRLDSYLARDD